MRKIILRLSIGLLAVLLLATLGLFGYRWITRIDGQAIQGRWVSDPVATLSYWKEHYDWATDHRLVNFRSQGLGQMRLEIGENHLSLVDHPCYGNYLLRYRIIEQEGNRYEIGMDKIVTWPHYASLRLEGNRLWSVTTMGNQEIREAFVLANGGT